VAISCAEHTTADAARCVVRFPAGAAGGISKDWKYVRRLFPRLGKNEGRGFQSLENERREKLMNHKIFNKEHQMMKGGRLRL